MRVRWPGQSAFTLSAGSTGVVIDPFDDAGEVLAARGLRFAHPVDRDLPADLLVVTHEHVDGASFETDELPGRVTPLAVVPAL